MDTVPTLSAAGPIPVPPHADAPPFVTAPALRMLAGSPRWPQILDVRKAPAWTASPHRIAGALRCAPDAIDSLRARLDPARPVICVCVHGHEVSQGAAARLRALGLDARFLEGGLEAWLAVDGPWRAATAPLQPPETGGSTWVTRAQPKIDRIAVPWLVRRFIDPLARFVYLPTDAVLDFAARTGAIAFDLPGGTISHDGERCSVDTLIEAAGLVDTALQRLAVIVRGADTDRLELAPQAAGLLAMSLGLSRLHENDDTMLDTAMILYDALYAWCRDARDEPHAWRPEAMR
jgi:rhodanese-related sulfurtransferase